MPNIIEEKIILSVLLFFTWIIYHSFLFLYSLFLSKYTLRCLDWNMSLFLLPHRMLLFASRHLQGNLCFWGEMWARKEVGETCPIPYLVGRNERRDREWTSLFGRACDPSNKIINCDIIIFCLVDNIIRQTNFSLFQLTLFPTIQHK